MGPHDNAAKLFNEQDRSRDELMIDLVETTGGALLGMTMSCCRCHDHKFDPVSQADYFRMRACFAGVKFADDLPIDLEDVQARAAQHNGAIDEQIAKLNEQTEQVLEAIRERLKSKPDSQAEPTTRAETIPDKPEELKKLANTTERNACKRLQHRSKRQQPTSLNSLTPC